MLINHLHKKSKKRPLEIYPFRNHIYIYNQNMFGNVPKYMNDNVIVLERFVNDLVKNIKRTNIIDFTLELQSLKDLCNVFTRNFQ